MSDQRWVRRIFEQGRYTVIGLVVVVLVAGGYFASGLAVEPDIQALLPKDAPSVTAAESFKRDYNLALTPAALLVEGSEPETNEEAVDALAEMLQAREDVASVQATRPIDFFQKRRLLYADLSTLQTLTERVEERVDWAKKRANPLFASLDDSEPPEIDADELMEGEEGGIPEHAHYRSGSGEQFVLFADLTFKPLDFQETAAFEKEVRDWLEEWNGEQGAEVALSLSGRHFKQIQQRRAHRRHISRATLLAGAAVLLFLGLYFRRWRAPLVVFGTLACGTVWAFGWAGLSVGRLTPLAASFGAVLIGLGIDYGIHLYVRYREELRGASHWEAVDLMFRKAGPPCFYACATTALAFGTLTTSSVPGFAEFGLIALGGILCILVAYCAILPLVVGGSPEEGEGGELPEESDGVRGWIGRRATEQRTRKMAALGLFVLSVPAGLGIESVTFNDSFKAVFVNDVPAIQAEETIRRSVEVRQQPAFVPVESLAHAERVVATIEERLKSRPEGELIDRVVSLNQFIPERQSEKIDVLRRLRETLADVPGGAVEDDEKLRKVRAELDFLLDHAPVERSDLPAQIRRRFAKADGAGEASIVAVFPTRPLYRATTAASYIDLLSNLPDADGGRTLAAVAYERMMSDFVGYIEQDAYRILGLLIAGLLALSFVAAPDLYEWVGSVITLAVALLVAAGYCGLLGIEFNVLNVVVWPIWIGVGLDALFHLNRHPPPVDPAERRQLSDFVATVGATAAAFATTMLGFGALAFSGHPGLASFGRAALVGFAAILLVSLLARIIAPRRI